MITLAEYEGVDNSFVVDTTLEAGVDVESVVEELVGPDEGTCLVVRRALSNTPDQVFQRSFGQTYFDFIVARLLWLFLFIFIDFIRRAEMSFIMEFAENLILRMMEDPVERDRKFREHTYHMKERCAKTKEMWSYPIRPYGTLMMIFSKIIKLNHHPLPPSKHWSEISKKKSWPISDIAGSLNGNMFSSDGHRGIIGKNTIFPACWPTAISASITLC
ncbi:unnamed protein product [Lactuca virosa]|uniref:Uncharacterized protein n=1 Tax=Lactuca virosa TaxID=75947 RepID=A0AAU9N1A0_9ASTR|nr:unnamed protein product [Lactuca virosa]